MTKFYVLLVLFLIAQSSLFAMNENFQKGYDLFYNYQFEKAEEYFKDQIKTAKDPFPYYAFYSYSMVRSRLANAEYEGAIEKADEVIAAYSPIFESYLRDHPQDVNAQFFYTVLLAGKIRIYLNKMAYMEIIKEAPRILSVKATIDHYKKSEFYEMSFGVGAFDYYLSVVGSNLGLGGLFNSTKSDGISDLIAAYENAEYTNWEAAIVLMYVNLYDKMDYAACDSLTLTFLEKYPKNLEVLAIAAECSFYQKKWHEGDIYLKHIVKLLNQDILRNKKGWRSRVQYLEGVRSMLQDENIYALEHFNKAYEMDAIEYSWYRAIILKYTGDVYLKMGLVRTAILYYEEVTTGIEISPHVREAKDLLKSLK